MRINIRSTLLLSVVLASNNSVEGFAPQQLLVERQHVSTKNIHQLWAKPKKKVKKKTSSASGGGFGSPATAKGGGPTTTDGKVRTVTGYTGSGTKPLRQAANTFDDLRKKYGSECCSDLYVRSPLNDEETFWFVGKIARCTEGNDLKGDSIPTEMEAVISQKRLILEYSKHQLRPQNFGGPYAKALEIWLAPGDSEMDVVQNKVTLTKVDGSVQDITDGFAVADVGFNPEIYIGDEIQKGGLRVQRDEEGRPIKAVFDINESE
mmetsp:Transcript_25211/g.38805  ORF Transcript_25211/g.38805 Transcript_25211/m.38805 type:complete len:263 (-) Transcript_25211:69-857(-)